MDNYRNSLYIDHTGTRGFVIGFIHLLLLMFGNMFFSGKRPKNLGLKQGKLAPCPNSPNCVASQTKSEKQFIEPFDPKGNPEQEMSRLKNILCNMKGVTVITSRKDYIHAECRTLLMGFVDDLEFFLDRGEGLIHVRSVSRLGYSDLGKNRKRVEMIRRLFEIRQ